MSDFLYDHDSDMLNENISAWELETALKSFHSGKAPGARFSKVRTNDLCSTNS